MRSRCSPRPPSITVSTRAPRKLSRRVRPELKGTRTSLGARTHFYEQIENVPFDIYALTLDKRRAHEELIHRKDHVYESIARHVIDQIPVEAATTRVELIIDRSKSKREIISFNGYITRQLRARLDRRVQLHIDHHRSTQNLGLQAADLFSWGIFRRYERNDPTWFDEMSVPCRLGALRLGHPMDGNTRECQASGEEYPRLDIDPSASAL